MYKPLAVNCLFWIWLWLCDIGSAIMGGVLSGCQPGREGCSLSGGETCLFWDGRCHCRWCW